MIDSQSHHFRFEIVSSCWFGRAKKGFQEQRFFTSFLSREISLETCNNSSHEWSQIPCHSLVVLTFKRLYSLAIGDSVISFRIFFLERLFPRLLPPRSFPLFLWGIYFHLCIFFFFFFFDRKLKNLQEKSRTSHFTSHFRFQLHHDAEKTREEILSLIAHHVTAVNYIYRDTRFDGRIKHRNIKFEVQRIKVIKKKKKRITRPPIR